VLPKTGGSNQFATQADEGDTPECQGTKDTAACLRQEIYFGTRADESSIYNRNSNSKWVGGQASLLVVAEVDIAQQGFVLSQNGGFGSGGPLSGGRMAFEGSGPGGHQSFKGLQARLQVSKLLIHPGEVNSFKSWPQNRRIIASHSDHHEIYIWDINLQQSSSHKHKAESSQANMILQGHDAPPTYALAWADCSSPLLASGGRDGSVVVWNLESHLSASEGFKAQPGDEQGRGNGANAAGFVPIDDGGILPTKTRVCKQISTTATTTSGRRQGKDAAGTGTTPSAQAQPNKNGKPSAHKD